MSEWTAEDRIGAGYAEHSIRVLHVEDDRALSEMYALGLRMHGFEVLVAHDGQGAIEAALQRAPDFVVLDVGLPDIDGLEVLDRLRADPRTALVPVALLTAFSPTAYHERARALGVCEVLLKPSTTPSELAAAISQHLAQARLE
ncbi:MAG TPA: response regulator [Candidatus Nitrosotalea sp.]|nr:response regulator [Candidatus Nitrosotalea sp.]